MTKNIDGNMENAAWNVRIMLGMGTTIAAVSRSVLPCCACVYLHSWAGGVYSSTAQQTAAVWFGRPASHHCLASPAAACWSACRQYAAPHQWKWELQSVMWCTWSRKLNGHTACNVDLLQTSLKQTTMVQSGSSAIPQWKLSLRWWCWQDYDEYGFVVLGWLP